MSFTIPRRRVLPVERIDVRLEDGPHPFERGRADAIAANWTREKKEKPALFDGQLVLLSTLDYRDGLLSGRCHMVRYSTFLLWRRMRPTPDAEHCFAHAMPVTSDGALLAIRMAAHTVNAGRVYFAAGSFEPIDFRDRVVDAPFNMARELREETGLDISGLAVDPTYHCYSDENGTAIFRRCYLPETADIIEGRVEAFVASDPEPEIAAPVLIRNRGDRPEGLMPHMPPLIAWHFATPEGSQRD